MPKVAIYCRLSDEDKGKDSAFKESESIQNQKNILTAYTLEKGWDIYKIYCDDDYSGTDEDRPEYNHLLQDAKDSRFDIVLCKTQSRFTRDMEHLEKYIHAKFSEWNIRFVSIVDNVDTDIKGNKKARQINGLINEWYLEDLSENVKAVLLSKKKDGKFVGAFAPYGYLKDPLDKNHLVVDPVASLIVKKIFDLYIDGISLRKIAKILNEGMVPSPVKYKQEVLGLDYRIDATSLAGKGKWTDSSISIILRNEMYIGNMVQNKSARISYKNHKVKRLNKEKWIIVKDTHEAIVSSDIFENVSELARRKNRPTQNGNVALYAGKLRCGSCYSSMVKQKSRKRDYYRCGYTQRNPVGCKGNFISEKLIDEQVLMELRKLIVKYTSESRIAKLIEEEKVDHVTQIKMLINKREAEIRNIDKVCMDMYVDKSNGVISEKQFIQMNVHFEGKQRELQKEVERLRDKIAELETTSEEYKPTLERKRLKEEIIKKYLNFGEMTRDMVVELIDYIVVSDTDQRGFKKIEIHWKF